VLTWEGCLVVAAVLGCLALGLLRLALIGPPI
jgi:hypothetical protein